MRDCDSWDVKELKAATELGSNWLIKLGIVAKPNAFEVELLMLELPPPPPNIEDDDDWKEWVRPVKTPGGGPANNEEFDDVAAEDEVEGPDEVNNVEVAIGGVFVDFCSELLFVDNCCWLKIDEPIGPSCCWAALFVLFCPAYVDDEEADDDACCCWGKPGGNVGSIFI